MPEDTPPNTTEAQAPRRRRRSAADRDRFTVASIRITKALVGMSKLDREQVVDMVLRIFDEDESREQTSRPAVTSSNHGDY